EEADAVDRLDEALDRAAEARRHPTVEDGDGDAVEVDLRLLGKLDELLVPQRLELAADVGPPLGELPIRHPLAQLGEPRFIEPVASENLLDGHVTSGHVGTRYRTWP